MLVTDFEHVVYIFIYSREVKLSKIWNIITNDYKYLFIFARDKEFKGFGKNIYFFQSQRTYLNGFI